MQRTPPSGPQQLLANRYFFPVLLVLVVTALYGQYVWNPILFDDINLFLLDAQGHQPVTDVRFYWWQFRSLPYVTLAWTQALLGQDLIYFRLGNLVLHAAVVLAMYGFILQLRRALAPDPHHDAANQWFALVAALIFALHPVAVYAAGYLIQRTILMATLFSVLALWAYARGAVNGQASWRWATVPLYYLAVFSKEHAIMLAAIFPLLTLALPSPSAQRWNLKSYPWGVWLVLFAMAVLVVILRRQFVGQAYELDASTLAQQSGLNQPYLSSVLTQTWLFFRYAGLWLVPNVAWMSVDMRVPFAATLWSWYGLSALAYGAWGAMGAWCIARGGRVAFLGLALLFPWLLGFTELVTVRLQEPLVLYRSYLWAAGAACFLSAVPVPVAGWGRKAGAVVSVLLVILFGLSMERLQTFSHPFLLWNDAARLLEGQADPPGAYRIYYNRGTEYLKAKQWAPAVADLQKSVQLQPGFAAGYGNLGVAYLQSARWPEALEAFTHAITLVSRTGGQPEARYYLGRARVYAHGNNPVQARQDYESACRISGAGCEKLH